MTLRITAATVADMSYDYPPPPVGPATPPAVPPASGPSPRHLVTMSAGSAFKVGFFGFFGAAVAAFIVGTITACIGAVIGTAMFDMVLGGRF